MDPEAIVHEGREQEVARLAFLERHAGRKAACAFAWQTLRIYRRAVVGRAAPAGEKIYRLRLLGSYCYLRRYVRECGTPD
jgi:hypothetical protein